jgi:tetratricopeptide (TPR) repeat protein
VVKQRGIEELEAIYEGMLKKENHHPNLEWYAGYASTKCAESNRRRRRPQKALAAYDRAIAHYERAAKANPHAKRSADLYVALALSGKARLRYEAGDDATAVADIVASMQRAPKAAATQDGVGISPADTAKMILARIVKEEKSDLVSVLETEMGKLDSELFVPRDNIPPVEDSGK